MREMGTEHARAWRDAVAATLLAPAPKPPEPHPFSSSLASEGTGTDLQASHAAVTFKRGLTDAATTDMGGWRHQYVDPAPREVVPDMLRADSA